MYRGSKSLSGLEPCRVLLGLFMMSLLRLSDYSPLKDSCRADLSSAGCSEIWIQTSPGREYVLQRLKYIFAKKRLI